MAEILKDSSGRDSGVSDCSAPDSISDDVPSCGDSDSSLPSCGDSDSSVPSCGVTDSSLPSCGVTDSSLPSCGVTDSSLPSCGVTDSSLPSCGDSDSSVPSCGVTDSILPSCNVSESSVPSCSVYSFILQEDCSLPCKLPLDELEALCRTEKLYCHELGVNRANVNEYEVEYLCDYKRTQVEEFYFVKWKGFSDSVNSWEPKRNLKCPKLMKAFHQDLDSILKLQKRRALPKRLEKNMSLFLVQKAKLRQSLQQWEADLNQTSIHSGRIFVSNEVDFEGPPKNFTYINNYKVGPGIVLDEMAVGCECKNCMEEPVNGCCPGASYHRMAYNNKGQVKIQPGKPIYECNSRCSCGPDCPNRVVQRGIQFDLCIFKTENGRGWGVRTLQHIKKNTFVMEYVGEIITNDEAEKRGHLYDCQGSTYLFDLDYVDDVYTVDAAHLGNISHFVNHSCNPNLQVFNVFIDNIDERLPRIALFSTRAIRAGEELTFDYKIQIDPVDTESTKMDSSFSLAELSPSPKKRLRVECRCGSESCRKYLF